jgi:hypothetical protein
MVTHLPARFYKLVPCRSSNKPRSRGNDLAGRSADPFLSARRFVLSRAMSEERDIFWLRLRSLNRYQTSHHFRLSSGKYRRFETRVRQAVKSECSKQSARRDRQSEEAEDPITVKEAVENIHRKKYLLPSIQREGCGALGICCIQQQVTAG